jgi:hypothetical protein
MSRARHLFPLITRTVRTPIAYTFVVMAWTERMRTGHIKQNGTDSTLLYHAFLPEVGTRGLVGLSLV